MKKFIIISLLLMTIGIGRVAAQVGISVNIGSPPAWGPYGYADARFYFMPDIDVYFDVWYNSYWYFDGYRWVSVQTLPPQYGYYDFYNGYKVVLDYRGNAPYRYYNNHRVSYAGYRNYRGPRQYTWRDRGGYRQDYGRGYAPRPAYRSGRDNYRPNRIEQGGGRNYGGERREPERRYENRGGQGRPSGGHERGGGDRGRGNQGGNQGNRGNGNQGGHGRGGR